MHFDSNANRPRPELLTLWYFNNCIGKLLCEWRSFVPSAAMIKFVWSAAVCFVVLQILCDLLGWKFSAAADEIITFFISAL